MEKKVPIDETRKKLLWFVVYVIWIVCDIEFVWTWDKRHIFFLVLFLVGTICVSFAELDYKYAKFLSFAAVIIAIIIFIFAPPLLPEETDIHGWLLLANEATPANGCHHEARQGDPGWLAMPLPIGALLFIAGTNGAWTTRNGKSIVLQVGTCLSVSVERQNEQLAIDADNFDTSDELVARIEQNEFNLVPGKFSYPKRPNRSTIIIFNKHGDLLFAVHYLNPNTVQITGSFVCSDKTKAVITNDSFIMHSPMGSGSVDHNCQEFGGRKAAFRVLLTRINP